MSKHDLKTWPEAFEAVRAGRKHHEIRKDDRGFAVGDVLRLREWKPGQGIACCDPPVDLGYTGRELRARVTYVSRVDRASACVWERDYLADGVVVLSVEVLS